jgi:hypothetical protein
MGIRHLHPRDAPASGPVCKRHVLGARTTAPSLGGALLLIGTWNWLSVSCHRGAVVQLRPPWPAVV